MTYFISSSVLQESTLRRQVLNQIGMILMTTAFNSNHGTHSPYTSHSLDQWRTIEVVRAIKKPSALKIVQGSITDLLSSSSDSSSLKTPVNILSSSSSSSSTSFFSVHCPSFGASFFGCFGPVFFSLGPSLSLSFSTSVHSQLHTYIIITLPYKYSNTIIKMKDKQA